MRIGQRYLALLSDDTLANGASLEVEIITPAAGLIRIVSIQGQASAAPCMMTLVEAPTITDGTTAIDIYNMNRNSDKEAVLELFSDPSGVSNGDTIERQLTTGTGVVMEDNYLVLKQDSTYLLKFTNGSGNTIAAQLRLVWEEEV
jgi:hypothetical protein